MPEANWNRSKPLPLFIQDEDSPASKILSSPFSKNLAPVSFDSLKLNLGNNLKFLSPPIANINASGNLIFNGPLDDNLEIRGLIFLRSGRINLFTTTFNFDRRYNNVAIFASGTGFIPYLDLSINSRVLDTVQDTSSLVSPEDFLLNSAAAGGIGGSRFVKVTLNAYGYADRLSETFQLRSVPSLPRSQILDLIGGNSLTMLLSGSEQQILANLINRSFVTPFLGNISDTFSDRVQIALYPTFINSSLANESSINQSNESNSMSDDLFQNRTWITELGFDLTNQLNLSLQATPNRMDIPPQGTLTFQLNSNLGILGTLDKTGNWQSQFQFFLRY